MPNKANCIVLSRMQSNTTRAWVYRYGEGWIFAELTPDELEEFRSYKCGITIPRMKVRLPYGTVIMTFDGYVDRYANWFAHCTMPQSPSLTSLSFQIHQITSDKPKHQTHYRVEPGSYEGWLWADEVAFCRKHGCEVTVHGGWGWREWGVPAEWRQPFTRPPREQYKEHTFIYALVDELTQEVRYVGKSDNPGQRLTQHLRDTVNPTKRIWIQSILAEDRKPKLVILEEVAVAVEFERERYWISYYWELGHNLTNDICQYWEKPRRNKQTNL